MQTEPGDFLKILAICVSSAYKSFYKKNLHIFFDDVFENNLEHSKKPDNYAMGSFN